MPFSYTNRQDKTYYLHAGKTKTGKDKYYCSQKMDGLLLDEVPEGFEIYENPDGLVYLRRELQTLLQQREIHFIEQEMKRITSMKEYEYRVEHDKDTITIFLIDDNPKELLADFMPYLALQKRLVEDFARRSGKMTAMMRFRLNDEEKRLFNAQRYCFRGSIDRWIPLTSGKSLEVLARKFIKHLGKDSFYDLM